MNRKQKYDKSEKGKARFRKYNESPKGRARSKKYNDGLQGNAARVRAGGMYLGRVSFSKSEVEGLVNDGKTE